MSAGTKVILCLKFPLKCKHSEEYSNSVLQLMDDILIEFISDISFKKDEVKTNVITEVSYLFKTPKSAESFYTALVVKMKQNDNPLMSTIKTVKINTKRNNSDDDKKSDSIVVIDHISFGDSPIEDCANNVNVLILDDINTIDKKFHYFFEFEARVEAPTTAVVVPRSVVIEPATVQPSESTIQPDSKSLSYYNFDLIEEMTVSSREEPILLVFFKSFKVREKFEDILKQKFLIDKIHFSIEIDEILNDVVVELNVKFHKDLQKDIIKFINTFANEYNGCFDSLVEVEFNRKIDVNEDLDMLLLYLENARCNGNDIVLDSHSVLNERYISFKFQNPITKLKFLGQDLNRIHSYKLYDYQLMSISEPFVEISFEIEPRMVILQNLKDKNDTYVELFAENIQRGNPVARKVKKSDLFSSTYYVEYSEECDFKELKECIQKRNKDDVKLLKVLKSKTLIVFVENGLINENVENLLKTHFAARHEKFLQVRRFSKNIYLITFTVEYLMDECLNQSKNEFNNGKIIYEQLFSFELLKMLDENNNVTSNIEKCIEIDEHFETLIRALFRLNKDFISKLEHELAIKVEAERGHKIKVYFNVQKLSEGKLRESIRAYLQREFSIQTVQPMSFEQEMEIDFDREKVFLQRLIDGRVEIIGVKTNVQELVQNFHSAVKAKEIEGSLIYSRASPMRTSAVSQRDVRKEFTISDQFDKRIKAVFLLYGSYLDDLNQKLERFNSMAVKEGNFVLRVSYEVIKTNENELKNFIAAHLEITFAAAYFESISVDEIKRNIRFNEDKLVLFDIGLNQVEAIGVDDDVEKLGEDVKSYIEVKRAPAMRTSAMSTSAISQRKTVGKEFTISDQFDRRIKAVFLLHGSYFDDLNQKLERFNSVAVKEGKFVLRVSYDVSKTNENELKNFIAAHFQITFAAADFVSLSADEIKRNIRFNEDKLVLFDIGLNQVEAIGVDDDIEKLGKDVKSYIEVKRAPDRVEIIVDERFNPLIRAIFLLGKTQFNNFCAKLNTLNIKSKIEGELIKVTFEKTKTDEKSVKNTIDAYLELNFKIQKIPSISRVEIEDAVRFNVENVLIYDIAGNQVEIIGLIDDVEDLEKAVGDYLKEKIAKSTLFIDEKFNPLVKAFFVLPKQFDSFKAMGERYSYVPTIVEGNRISINFDVTKTNEKKIEGIVAAYFELNLKIETVKEINWGAISEKYRIDADKIYIHQKNANEVEILGVADDVEDLVKSIDERNLKGNEIVIVLNAANKLLKALLLLNDSHMAQFQQKMQTYSCVVTPEREFNRIRIVFDPTKMTEAKIQNLVLAYLELNFKIEVINGIKANEIKRMFKFDALNVCVEETVSGAEIIGAIDDVEDLEKLIDESQKHQNASYYQFDLNQRLIYRLLNKPEVLQFFLAEGASVDRPNTSMVVIRHDNREKLKELIQNFEKSFWSSQIVVPYLPTELDLTDNNQLLLNHVNKQTVCLIGQNEVVEQMTKRINFYFNEELTFDHSFRASLAQSRLLVLTNFKANIEKAYPGLSFKITTIENDKKTFKLQFENATRTVLFNAKQNTSNLFDRIVKYVYTKYDKAVVRALNEAELFKMTRASNFVFSFELNDERNEITVYMLDSLNLTTVKDFIDNFIRTNLPHLAEFKNEHAIGDVTIQKILKVKLYEYRVIFINRLDRLILKRWPDIQCNLIRKEEKIELIGKSEDVEDAEKVIKNALDNIICEKVHCEQNVIKYLKNKEKDLVKTLFDMKIFCVIDFNVEGGNMNIYSTNQDSINKCKNYLHSIYHADQDGDRK